MEKRSELCIQERIAGRFCTSCQKYLANVQKLGCFWDKPAGLLEPDIRKTSANFRLWYLCRKYKSTYCFPAFVRLCRGTCSRIGRDEIDYKPFFKGESVCLLLSLGRSHVSAARCSFVKVNEDGRNFTKRLSDCCIQFTPQECFSAGAATNLWCVCMTWRWCLLSAACRRRRRLHVNQVFNLITARVYKVGARFINLYAHRFLCMFYTSHSFWRFPWGFFILILCLRIKEQQTGRLISTLTSSPSLMSPVNLMLSSTSSGSRCSSMIFIVLSSPTPRLALWWSDRAVTASTLLSSLVQSLEDIQPQEAKRRSSWNYHETVVMETYRRGLGPLEKKQFGVLTFFFQNSDLRSEFGEKTSCAVAEILRGNTTPTQCFYLKPCGH